MKKPKILIFGDSFGSEYPQQHFSTFSETWHRQLGKKYKVANHCEYSSGFYYSYLKLKKLIIKNKNYKIIFLVSDPRRHYTKNPKRHLTVTDLETWDGHRDSPKMWNFLVRMRRNYFKYFFNDNIEKYQYKLMVEDLKNTYKDKILLLKCFPIYDDNNYGSEIQNIFDNTIALGDISMYESKQIPIIDDKWKSNHMLIPHHRVLYKKIDNWIEKGDFTLDKTDLLDLPTDYKLYDEIKTAPSMLFASRKEFYAG